MLGLTGFIIAAFCVAASLQDTPFTTCSSGDPAPELLRVSGCDEQPCQFVRGTDVEARWDFNVVADAEGLRPVVKAKALGMTITYPLPEQDACKSLINGQCPLETGELISYGLRMPVLKSYPKVPFHLTFSLVDTNNIVHACFELDAQVVDA